jgi:capsular exopolysaccharide synthesis family protein
MLPKSESHHAAGASVLESAPAGPRLFGNRPLSAPPAESNPASSLDPRRIVNGLTYHWFLFIVLGSLLGGGLGWAAWELLPSKYTTYAVIRVAAVDPERIVDNRDGGRSEFVTYLKTQANLIKSEFVIRAALRDSKIGNTETLKKQEDPIRYLEEQLLIEFSENSEIMKVTLTGDNPREIADIVNAVTAAYMKEVVHKDQTDRKAAAEELEHIRKSWEEGWKNTQQLVKDKKKPDAPASPPDSSPANSVLNPAAVKTRLAPTEISRMNEELRRAEVDATVAMQKVKDLQARQAKVDTLEVPAQEMENFLANDEEFKYLQQRVKAAEKKAGYLKAVVTDPKNADYQDALETVKKRQQEVEDYRRKLKGEKARLLQAMSRRELDGKLDEARTVAMAQDLRVRMLKAQLANVEPMKEVILANNRTLTDITSLSPEETALMQMTDVYQLLLRKINLMNIETQTSPRVTVVQQASVPIKREMKKQLFGTGLGGLMGFAMIGACITLFENRVRRVFSSRDVSANPNVNMLGLLPEITSRDPGMTDGKADPFVEAVDQVRVLLGRHILGQRSQAILITSAEAGEGKTTLAGHLAVSLTKADRKTILVDCSLRNPEMHEHLGLSMQPGVCELLRGEQTFNDVVQRTGIANLWFLSAGTLDAQAQQALGRDKMRRIFDKLRQDFDTIVIDSHAVLPAADALLIGQHCDAVVMCARRFVSRMHHVEDAYQRVSDLGVPNCGMIFLGEAGK